jgi:hypothetical protein
MIQESLLPFAPLRLCASLFITASQTGDSAILAKNQAGASPQPAGDRMCIGLGGRDAPRASLIDRSAHDRA